MCIYSKRYAINKMIQIAKDINIIHDGRLLKKYEKSQTLFCCYNNLLSKNKKLFIQYCSDLHNFSFNRVKYLICCSFLIYDYYNFIGENEFEAKRRMIDNDYACVKREIYETDLLNIPKNDLYLIYRYIKANMNKTSYIFDISQ
jgi:hypothetical protein